MYVICNNIYEIQCLVAGDFMKKVLLFLLLFSTCSAGLHGEDFPQIKGWTANNDIIIYRPANLWKYIDGAADSFLSYDFQILKLREFQKSDVIVTVDIYDMGTPINAFGIYSTERPDDAKLLAIGTESVVIAPYSALMLKDRFYVKVMIQQGELSQKDGEDILKDVAASLPGTTEFPSEIKILPQKELMPGTVKYVATGYMGLSEINNVVSANYRTPDGKEYRSFVMVLPKKEQVDETWKHLSGKWQTETQKDKTVLYREVPYEGFIGVIISNGMITGVSGVEEKAKMFKLLIEK
jgi:hypothetical protein